MHYDTIIIGAGMSGLAAGIRLAHYEKRVCILERHTTIGGLNSFYRLGGRNYDVGLHAVTNYTPKGTRRGPLARLLRQLRFKWDEFALAPQIGSRIAFPDVNLRFSNDAALLEEEIRREFPDQIDNFRTLVEKLITYEDLGGEATNLSAREVVSETITDPLLVEMLFCPLLYYGGPREHDIDFAQFSIMMRSIFLEGLSRPFAGVRLLLKKLTQRFKQLGGELRLRAGVSEIVDHHGRASGVRLDDGNELTANNVLSSAGWVETMRMCGSPPKVQREPGKLSFTETISVLDRQPRDMGHDETIVFFNDCPKFHWKKPDELVDLRSGVICSPNNFRYDTDTDEGVMRITSLADFDRWSELDTEAYGQQKLVWFDRISESAVRFVPDFRRAVVDTDMFTPTTIRRFTGHDNGAVYGAPIKQFDGKTHLSHLYLCGTDQGMVGIIGAIVSGITIANRYLLTDSPVGTSA